MSTGEAPTPLSRLSPAKRALLEKRLRNQQAKMVQEQTIEPRKKGENTLPLSFAQQRLWFIDQLEPGNATYNMANALRLSGPLKISALERTINEIIRRHEALRTTFSQNLAREPVQIIAPELKLSLQVEDLSQLNETERKAEAQVLASVEAHRPFDLSRGPLVRARLLRLAAEEHVLLFTMHHIVSDGWSMGVLVNEIGVLYSAYAQNKESPLAELEIQYADFALWQRRWLQGRELEEQLSYWKRQLGGDLPSLELPTDHPRPPVQGSNGAHEFFYFPIELTDELRKLSFREDATLFMTLLAAFQVLLYRYTGQEDFPVGSPTANRNRPETENLIGFFVNTLVLRANLRGNPTFRELLGRVQKMALEAYAHQDLPFEKLVEELHPDRDLSRNPLIQIILALQNMPVGTLELPGLNISAQEFEYHTVRVDLEFHLNETAKGLAGMLAYNADLFDKETIQHLLGHFSTLLEAIVANPDQRISDLPLLTARERARLLFDFNDTKDRGTWQAVQELFETQVEHRPDAVALEFEGQTISYAELESRANKLAHYLRARGVGPETLVALLLERSPDQIIAILAVLKAGGAYVPIDIGAPAERRSLVLRNSEVKLLLTHKEFSAGLADGLEVVALDKERSTIAGESEERMQSGVAGDNAAYMIYTSASTGQPKGVLVSHRSLINSVLAMVEVCDEPVTATILQLSYAFDGSLLSIFCALSEGARITICSEGQQADVEQLARLIAGQRTSHLWLVPSFYSMLLQYAAPAQLDSLRVVHVGAEACPPQLVERHYQVVPQARLFNIYGPTEAAIWSTSHQCRRSDEKQPVPIGGPASNVQVYLLDKYLQPVPIGVAGRLYVGGLGLARGYWNRPELTAEVFIPNPYANKQGERLYRTGDIARYLRSGELVWLGREDQQVKVRGYRIELGEIEAALAHIPWVRDAVVVARARPDGAQRVAAYVVAGDAQPAAPFAALREQLKGTLPEYMIPSSFVFLDKLPLTATGKVDRRALSDPEPGRDSLTPDFVPPSTPVEEGLVRIWSELLKIEKIGIDDNFFDLGGHSLLATRLISHVRESFNVDLALRTIFELPTIAGLALRIEAAKNTGKESSPPPLVRVARKTRRQLRQENQVEPLNKTSQEERLAGALVPVSREGQLPLSFAQQRLWFMQALEPESAAYNVAFVERLKGVLDHAALEKTISEIARRHETLRTSFSVTGGQLVQVVAPPQDLLLPVTDLSHLPESERLSEAQAIATAETRQPFDLERGPLFGARLVRLGSEDHLLIVSMHHIISDAWGLGIMLRELATLYAVFTDGKPSPLPPLPIQYVDFAHWQRRYLTGDVLDSLLQYWQQQLGGTLPVLELPADRPRPAIQSYLGAAEKLIISPELTAQLKVLARREGVTLFMLLLAAFNVLLHRYTGEEDIIVGTPIANRNRVDIEGLIGFFVNMLVLRTDLSGVPTFRELLDRVRTTALEAYAHQDMPFEKLVEHLHPERSMTRHPLFQVLFQLGNAPMGEAEVSGLVFEGVHVETNTTQFDLSLDLMEAPEGIVVAAEYSTDLFDAATISRLLRHFQRLLESVVAHPEERIARLSMLTDVENYQLIRRWNDNRYRLDADKCLPELFEAQVKQNPGTIAVAANSEQLTYEELNSRANQLGHFLRGLGVGPEVRVGVLMERSIEMVTSLLAILKAGGAYVPLDPLYPENRLSYLTMSAQVSLLLTHEHLQKAIPDQQIQVVCPDAAREEIARHSAHDLVSTTAPENLAYVIYTSGSTGQPKGVGVTHKSLVNHQAVVRNAYGLGVNDRVLQFASLSFDVAAEEIFPTLLSGATLVLRNQQVQAVISGILPEVRDQNVTVLNLPASAWHELVVHLSADFPDCLRLLVVGSEPVTRESFAAWRKRVGDRADLRNAYGTTETTITATVYQPEREGESHSGLTLPIGRPLPNTQAYILDRFLQPVPVGIPGELYIGGAGVARCYLNQPHSTAERFVPDPFGNERGARLYRTGDLTRYLPDGNIEFIGRADRQVKVRGYRVELGEIEAVLSEHPGVRQAVLETRPDVTGNERLVAYVVTDPDHAITRNKLREFLRERLPEFMIPGVFVTTNELPLTLSGKVDHRALPGPEEAGDETKTLDLPRSRTERLIANVWREVLQVEKVGIHENFFDLGGHSLLMVRVHDGLRETFEKLTMLDLFKYPTINKLAAFLMDEQLPLKVETRKEQTKAEGAEIAIIGMAGRFPGARTLDQFWQNLCGGVEAIEFYSDEELLAAGVAPALLSNPNYVKAGIVLDDIDLFDASFFGYSPREAEVMDPQHRLFLECAWEALEHAGHDPERTEGSIGVFAGTGTGTYVYNLLSNPGIVEAAGGMQLAIGNDKDHLPTHVSYKLNLRGPSVAVQTACSASLVAVHMACRSVLEGECRMALAGGVAIHDLEKRGYLYQEGGIGSPDGHCRAFDAGAQGTVSSSGVGIVVLKRLQDALMDGDFIHAVIKGSAINNDGSAKVGYTAPSIEGQAGAIRAAQIAAGIPAEDITYIEAHGTGTRLGDPIEISALTQAFRETTNQKGFCAVGSVKSNIGHLDTAAGVAGLIKTVLALKNKVIPPSLHFEQPNPALDLDNSPFYINRYLSTWKSANGARRAGVSSFGIGGTNAHVIVEEAPAVQPSGGSRPWQLVMLSAKTESALDYVTANLAQSLRQHPETNLADVAYTLQVGRKTFEHRRVVMCRTIEDALNDSARVFNSTTAELDQKVVFMFPGQGAQHVNMGLDLYQREAVFREQVDHCLDLLQPHLDLRDILYPSQESTEDAASRLKQTYVTQPALFVIEYALARLWMSWGIKPCAMIGHSIGEYVAACLAGVLSLEDALLLVALRGNLMQMLPKGAMLSVALGEAELREIIGPQLSLAAVNGPALSVVSGPHEAIAELEARLAENNTECRRLVTSHAFHSQMMDPVIGKFTAKVSSVKLNTPHIPYLSNVTGSWIKSSEVTAPGYWARHLRETVRFADGARALLSDSNAMMLEVGPGRSLCTIVKSIDREGGRIVINSLPSVSEQKSASESLTEALAKLWLAGAPVDWQGYYSHETRHRVPLPTYPFERRRYWVEWQPMAGNGQFDGALYKKPEIADWFYLPHWKPSVLPVVSVPQDHSPIWLVLLDGDECGVSRRIAKQLKQSGCEVIAVSAGKAFARLDDGSYAINVAQPQDYETLLRELKALGKLPNSVLHSLSLKAEDYLRDGFYSIIFLARALSRHASGESVNIAILSDGIRCVTGEENIVPEKAILLGPCTVIPQEYSQLTCRNIDLVIPETSSWREQHLIAQVAADLLSRPEDTAVAYRANQRWVQAFEPVKLQRVIDTGLREEGVYLITGGWSGIGFELAKHLARTKRAKLVLISRSLLPAGDERVREIEELGGEVLAVSADVSDADRMREVLRQARAKFGKVNGVIHAAGVAPGRLIEAEQDAQAVNTLAPKVKGTRVLEELFKDERLDFLVLFSSLSSVLGAFGQVDYCAANAFLDAFAHYNIQQNNIPTVAINWDTWRDTGMALRAMQQFHTGGGEDLMQDAISTAAGLDAFERVLAHKLMPQVLVSTRDLHNVIRLTEKHTQSQIFDETVPVQQAGPAHPRPALQTAHVAPRNELEEQIAAMWENLLGIERVGVHDNFFELGGHSLLAMQLGSRFREALRVDLPLRILFERPTVAELAEYVEQLWLDLVAAPTRIAKVDRDLHRRSARES